MLLNFKILIITILVSLVIQNKQGDFKGSIFIKMDTQQCFHLHHWILSIVLLIIIFYFFRENKMKIIIINTLLGFGIAGFIQYSDRFNIIKKCII